MFNTICSLTAGEHNHNNLLTKQPLTNSKRMKRMPGEIDAINKNCAQHKNHPYQNQIASGYRFKASLFSALDFRINYIARFHIMLHDTNMNITKKKQTNII